MVHDEECCFLPTFDLGEFRYSVARYLKLLIRARWRCDPGFLSQKDLADWGLTDLPHDRLPAARLLYLASEALAHLNRHFLPRCDSGGVQQIDESTPVGRLIDAVAFLVHPAGGAPGHNATLVESARWLHEGGTLDWAALADWSLLPAIRADLDQLPHPQRSSQEQRLERVETLLTSLVEREQVKDWYDIAEFARMVGKAEFTCREWCRLGRIQGEKRGSGRGKYQSWVVSHDELQRYRKEGLLPLRG
ncbi:MAG: hypothetical protein U0840_29835 [Gemmataceae bacterium]